MTTHRLKTSWEEYFDRQDDETRRVSALQTQVLEEEASRGRLKELHYMRCPKCGLALVTASIRGVLIDRCYSCNGSWLDDGELEQLGGKGAEFTAEPLVGPRSD